MSQQSSRLEDQAEIHTTTAQIAHPRSSSTNSTSIKCNNKIKMNLIFALNARCCTWAIIWNLLTLCSSSSKITSNAIHIILSSLFLICFNTHAHRLMFSVLYFSASNWYSITFLRTCGYCPSKFFVCSFLFHHIAIFLWASSSCGFSFLPF